MPTFNLKTSLQTNQNAVVRYDCAAATNYCATVRYYFADVTCHCVSVSNRCVAIRYDCVAVTNHCVIVRYDCVAVRRINTKISAMKMPACNLRFGASGAVTPQKRQCELASDYPAGTAV